MQCFHELNTLTGCWEEGVHCSSSWAYTFWPLSHTRTHTHHKNWNSVLPFPRESIMCPCFPRAALIQCSCYLVFCWHTVCVCVCVCACVLTTALFCVGRVSAQAWWPGIMQQRHTKTPTQQDLLYTHTHTHTHKHTHTHTSHLLN